MRKAICASILVLTVLLLVRPQPADAHGPGRVYFGPRVYIGPGYWWPRPWWGPGWWGPAYPYPYSYSPPVVVQQPPVSVQPPPAPEESQYWYYCQDPQGYFPYVRQCPQGWMKVVPPAPPGQ